jgi:arylsulfatase A-like enzyme
LPAPPYPNDQFPGHAAWTDGDWKLHRIENKQGKVRWELYHLDEDPRETEDLAASEPAVVKRLQPAMQTWLTSVVNSCNGGDY